MWSVDLLATWSTAVQSARRQAFAPRRVGTTIPIYGMTMRFRRSSRGTDNFDQTTTTTLMGIDKQSGYPSEDDDNDATVADDAHP